MLRDAGTIVGDPADAAAAMIFAARSSATTGSGWTVARSSIHGSRGRTQMMRSCGTFRASNQMIASVAVLPEADDDVVARRPGQAGELVDGGDAGVVGDVKRRRCRDRDRRREVGRVDDAAPHVHGHGLP